MRTIGKHINRGPIHGSVIKEELIENGIEMALGMFTIY